MQQRYQLYFEKISSEEFKHCKSIRELKNFDPKTLYFKYIPSLQPLAKEEKIIPAKIQLAKKLAKKLLDVDCIVDVISFGEYHKLRKKLTAKGFKRSLTEDVICRWFYDDIKLDIMPTDEKILGFDNRWYKKAIEDAVNYNLSDNLDIKIVTVPYFLATKLEAFKTRCLSTELSP